MNLEPEDVWRALEAEKVEWFTRFRLLRSLFKLSVEEAKQVIYSVKSKEILAEHLVEALEEALEEGKEVTLRGVVCFRNRMGKSLWFKIHNEGSKDKYALLQRERVGDALFDDMRQVGIFDGLWVTGEWVAAAEDGTPVLLVNKAGRWGDPGES